LKTHSHQQIGRSTKQPKPFPPQTANHFPNGSAKVMSFLGKKKWSHRRMATNSSPNWLQATDFG